jgi:hypothetical protein
MVTITNYTKRKREDGTAFCVLEINSGIELYKVRPQVSIMLLPRNVLSLQPLMKQYAEV